MVRRVMTPSPTCSVAFARNVPRRAWLGAFWSGAVGYFSYDVVRTLERLPSPPPVASTRLTRCSFSPDRS
jgi:hypothetical protein